MAIMMVCNVSIAACASNTLTESTDEVSEMFVTMCDNLFQNSEKYRALDENQNDVTLEFINKYSSEYKNGEYNILLQHFEEELYGITWEEETQSKTRGTIVTREAEKSFYIVDECESLINGKSFELIYRINGEYSFDSSTKQIVDRSPAIFNVDWFEAGSMFDYETFDVGGSNAITSGGNRVCFRVTFSLRLLFNTDLGLTLTEELGPYTGSVIGYAQ